MFDRLDCVCVHTDDLDASLNFMKSMGLTVSWRLDREDEGRPWSIVGLTFPDKASSQLVFSTHPDRRFIGRDTRKERERHLRGPEGEVWCDVDC